MRLIVGNVNTFRQYLPYDDKKNIADIKDETKKLVEL